MRSLNGQVPPALDSLVARCLDPDSRLPLSVGDRVVGCARRSRPTRRGACGGTVTSSAHGSPAGRHRRQARARDRGHTSHRGHTSRRSRTSDPAPARSRSRDRGARRRGGRRRLVMAKRRHPTSLQQPASVVAARRQLQQQHWRGGFRRHRGGSVDDRAGERLVPERVQPPRRHATCVDRDTWSVARRADRAPGGHARGHRPRDRRQRRTRRYRLSPARARTQSRGGHRSGGGVASGREQGRRARSDRRSRQGCTALARRRAGRGPGSGAAPETFTAATLEAAHAYTEAQAPPMRAATTMPWRCTTASSPSTRIWDARIRGSVLSIAGSAASMRRARPGASASRCLTA